MFQKVNINSDIYLLLYMTNLAVRFKDIEEDNLGGAESMP